MAGFKKTLSVLLTATLTGVFAFGVFQYTAHPATADETVNTDLENEAMKVPETDTIPILPEEGAEAPAALSGLGMPDAEQPPEAREGIEPTKELVQEEPYWLADTTYADLLSIYELAQASGSLTQQFNATFTVTASSPLSGEIMVGEKKVLSNGMNIPEYDNLAGMQATPREGLPQVGMRSDRSVLTLIETREDSSVYEALFFFGSAGYPDAPFVALRTYIVLENKEESDASIKAQVVEETKNEEKTEESEEVSSFPPTKEASVKEEEGDRAKLPLISKSPTAQKAGLGAMPLYRANDLYVGYTFNAQIQSVYDWNGLIVGGQFTVGFLWDGQWVAARVLCLDPGLHGPLGPDPYNYLGRGLTATITGIDRLNGRAYLNVFVPAPVPGLTQRLEGWNVPVPVQFSGSLSLIKNSASPDITSDHPCYDLAGAEYGLYQSFAEAENDTNRIHTFVSDTKGNTDTAHGLPNAYYYLKELKAPKGYELDTTIHLVEHLFAATYKTLTDTPLSDPTVMLVQKLDTQTGQAYGKDDPNGSLLAGAEFTVRYWDDIYASLAEAEAAGAPTRTWVFKTGDNGVVQFGSNNLSSGDDLYANQYGNAIIPIGSVAIQESSPPPGYLLPDPNPVSFQTIEPTGDPLAPVSRLNTVIQKEEPREVIVEKIESSTNEPVADTEFTLFKESALGAGDWQAVSSHVTDSFGKCVFSPVATGSYKLDETRANPLYAELRESNDDAHYFEISKDSTGEVHVFKNDLIQVSIGVYKKTIPLTSSALDGTKDNTGKNVGLEEYLYRFGAKNSSNVRVDEFVITDSLEYVTTKGYRMTTLWTGTAPEGMDYDGLMTILYKTNMTSPAEQPLYSYDLMAANPPNPNNPEQRMSVALEPGWRIWQEKVSTTTAIRLEVSDLELNKGEYIIGIRAVYGGVVKGFYTGTGFENSKSPQSYGGDRDAIQTLQASTFTPFELRDWYYSVVATGALLPLDEMGNETVMSGSIRADLFRNWADTSPVLTDSAKDKVETRVIKPFTHAKEDLGIGPKGFFANYGRWGLPLTGDAFLWWLSLLGILAFVGAGTALALAVRKKRQYTQAERRKSHE